MKRRRCPMGSSGEAPSLGRKQTLACKSSSGQSSPSSIALRRAAGKTKASSGGRANSAGSHPSRPPAVRAA
eukprot:10309038-Lingulodinium_polyedra.AAC.1